MVDYYALVWSENSESAKHFGEILIDYKLSKKDQQRVLDYAAKLKQKKKK